VGRLSFRPPLVVAAEAVAGTPSSFRQTDGPLLASIGNNTKVQHTNPPHHYKNTKIHLMHFTLLLPGRVVKPPKTVE